MAPTSSCSIEVAGMSGYEVLRELRRGGARCRSSSSPPRAKMPTREGVPDRRRRLRGQSGRRLALPGQACCRGTAQDGDGICRFGTHDRRVPTVSTRCEIDSARLSSTCSTRSPSGASTWCRGPVAEELGVHRHRVPHVDTHIANFGPNRPEGQSRIVPFGRRLPPPIDRLPFLSRGPMPFSSTFLIMCPRPLPSSRLHCALVSL